MPVYLYRFYDGAEVEIEQPITDEAHDILIHPERGVPASVKRVPQSPSIKLIGKGFYRTGG